jgi:hypothetical protein
MQRAKASAAWTFVDWKSADLGALDEPPATVDEELLPNAAAGRAKAAVAIMAAAFRAVGGHARHGRRMTKILLLIVPSPGWIGFRPGRRSSRRLTAAAVSARRECASDAPFDHASAFCERCFAERGSRSCAGAEDGATFS